MSGDVGFRPVSYGEVPAWDRDDHGAALEAFVRSCGRVLAAVRSGALAGQTAPSPGLLNACHHGGRLASKKVEGVAAKAFFEEHFTPHSVVHAAAGGLLTGYYEPHLEGSRTPTAKFRVPVYRRPPDLVNVVDETMRGAVGSTLTHVRRTKDGQVPYATRAEIEQGALEGQGLELFYLVDPVDVFFMQVQGSGLIKLTDGARVRIGYDGKNGHPYTSIGRYLIDTGQLAVDQASMQGLAKWLRADGQRGRQVMWRNASYVFFRELGGEEAGSAQGAHKIPLTPGRSLAVDAGVHAIGTPIYVSAPTLTHATKATEFNRLMIAQDVGSAIKGPERGDIYFGSGAAAAKLAGVTRHPGRFFALLPRTVP